MKKILLAVIIVCAAIMSAFVLKGPLNVDTLPVGTTLDSDSLALGEKAPLTSLALDKPDGSGSETLESLKKKNGILVVFSCNTCPFVIAWEDRYKEINNVAKDNGIAMVLVNSNEARRDGDDAPNKMLVHQREQKYSMPYLIDKNHVLADAFGAKTTPHVFLFDKDFKLVYEGAIDDNYKDKSGVKQYFTKDALKALGAGKEIAVKSSPAKGCSIKRLKS